MKQILALVVVAALAVPAWRRPDNPLSSADTAVFVAYYWRAKPGKLDEYNAYIKNIAEAIDENARRAGVFEEVRTVTPAPGTVDRLDAPADFPLEERGGRTGARRRSRCSDAARRAGRGDAQGEQRAVGRPARSGPARGVDAAAIGPVRIRDCRGRMFVPRLAGVAQLVEQLIRNQQVTRSSRVAGSTIPSTIM